MPIRAARATLSVGVILMWICAAQPGAQRGTPGRPAAASRPAPEPAPRPELQPPETPTFKAETNLIEVDTVVTDGQGNVVRGLTKDDFSILDDGKAQPVSTFAFVDLPVSRVEAVDHDRAVPPDVSTNARPFDGRVYVLVLDDLHVDPDVGADVVKEARLFVDRYLGDHDLMAVAYSSGRKDAGQDFTTNRRLLLAAIAKFNGRRPLVTTAPSLGATAGSGSGPATNQSSVGFERSSNATRMLRFMRDLADS